MTFNRRIRGAGGRAIAALLTAGVAILIWGLIRYGGPEGVWRRVYGEIAPRLPHAAYVPTPLPITPTPAVTHAPGRSVTLTLADAARLGATASPSPTSTAARTTAASAAIPATTTATTPAATATPVETQPAQQVATRETPTPRPSPIASLRLTGLSHYWQTWNNCGPATLAMHLSYFGIKLDQDVVGGALRPVKDDKNVSPEELAAYARTQGLRAVVRVNGSSETLRQLLMAGVPVLIETWHEPKPNDGMGHYRLIAGFDDAAGAWIAYDSYDSRGIVKGQPYAGIRLPYAETDAAWAVFNRAYVVLYDAARAAAVEAIIGADLDDAAMWARSLAAAEAATLAAQGDPFAWFNLGSSLAALERWAEAADAFDRARRLGLPWRMLWYQFAPFRAYYEVGRYDEVIALADATLRSAKDTIEELYYWKGMAQHAAGDPASARASWQRALELNPNNSDARAALNATP